MGLILPLLILWWISEAEKRKKAARPRTYSRPRLDPSLRMAVIRRDGYMCQLCRKPVHPRDVHIDHKTLAHFERLELVPEAADDRPREIGWDMRVDLHRHSDLAVPHDLYGDRGYTSRAASSDPQVWLP
jgi:5-methylcytosine-specific restriction endonuclease McrA